MTLIGFPLFVTYRSGAGSSSGSGCCFVLPRFLIQSSKPISMLLPERAPSCHCLFDFRAALDFVPSPAFHFVGGFECPFRRRVCFAPHNPAVNPARNFNPRMKSFRALPHMPPHFITAALIGRPSTAPLGINGITER